MSEPDSEARFSLRLSLRANNDIAGAMRYLEDQTQDEAIAPEWREGLYAEIGALSVFPRRFAVAERESRDMGFEVRQMLYRRGPGTVAYRVYYRVLVEGDDGPTVVILHVRHAARRPMTREEARRIAEIE